MAKNADDWPVQSIENGILRLDYLTQAGPRILRLVVGGKNLFAELPEAGIESAAGYLQLFGGHRLWHSPETTPRTYIPDDRPPQIQANERSVLLTQEVEPETGIQKSIHLELAEDEPCVTVTHRLKNQGLWAVDLAPWALTMLPLGGTAILPDQVGPLDPNGLLANRSLALWPYTRWHDDRLHLDDHYLLLDGRSQLPPVKIGTLDRQGWAGYYRNGILFCKRFRLQLDRVYPDYGCNVEVYCNHQFLELESLGPVTRMEPGQTVEHVEYWQVIPNLSYPATLEGITEMVEALRLVSRANP